MPNDKNKTNLETIKSKLTGAKSVVLANYAGLKVNQINELRQKLSENNAEAGVYKNTLIRIAVKDEFGADLTNEQTSGPTLVITSKDDAVSPVKALFEYIKENKLPQIKLGFLGHEYLDPNKVEALSSLPSKIELLSRLVRTLKNPSTRFTRTIANPSSKFVYALSAIAKKQQ